jgi:hypothetical protein
MESTCSKPKTKFVGMIMMDAFMEEESTAICLRKTLQSSFELKVNDEDPINDPLEADSLGIGSLSLAAPVPAKYWPQVFKWIHECEHEQDVLFTSIGHRKC